MEKCCKKVKISVNLSKAETVLFTSRYKVDSLSKLTMCDREITVVKEAKYLGIKVDSKLKSSKKVLDSFQRLVLG